MCSNPCFSPVPTYKELSASLESSSAKENESKLQTGAAKPSDIIPDGPEYFQIALGYELDIPDEDADNLTFDEIDRRAREHEDKFSDYDFCLLVSMGFCDTCRRNGKCNTNPHEYLRTLGTIRRDQYSEILKTEILNRDEYFDVSERLRRAFYLVSTIRTREGQHMAIESLLAGLVGIEMTEAGIPGRVDIEAEKKPAHDSSDEPVFSPLPGM
jgi:hypothetical protein